ncbi:MAG TPA: type II toxin-antitoxin system VapC family toxin [Verrucomicrobiota bacterium]|nr:VapC toxin family PIN domain ribonuclease [Verrucomicrobiales bacterium]HRI13195.1 type II toxin-antitoxin system VapC family toxin [Verrucomicrobiota bacterium]
MKWLLDTNVICEPGKRRPHAKVVAWLDSLPEQDCALSVLTLGEIEKGIHALLTGPERRHKEIALTALRRRFAGRILDVDDDVATKWGELMGEAQRIGHPLPAVDNLLAATAVVHSLTLATRDTGDIALGVRVFNPFK